MMDVDVKFFQRPDTGEPHLSVTGCGIIDPAAMEKILIKIVEVIRSVPDCCILVDLRHGNCRLKPSDIYALVRKFEPDLLLSSNRIAYVSPPRSEEYDQLYMLTACLWSRGSKIEAFYHIGQAIKWLRSSM
jgi:hypothetical protein